MRRFAVLAVLANVLILLAVWPRLSAERSVTGPHAPGVQIVVPNMAELRHRQPREGDGVMVLGYHQPGDGGGGAFFWDPASTSPDDLGTVIVPVSAPAVGRWRRVVTSPVSVRWFGAVGDGGSHPLSNYFSSLARAQAFYPHAVNLGDEIDWAAIQAALDWLPGANFGKGGGEVRLPRGDYRLSRPLEITKGNTALVGEAAAASTLTYSSSGNWTGPFTFVRAGVDTKTTWVFRVTVRDLFFDSGTNPPAGSIGLDATGMSHSDFRNLTVQFRSNGCTGVYGTAENGGSPYYNVFTNISVYGPSGAYGSNGCRGYWFTGDPKLAATHPRRRFAPNANCIRGGRLAGLEIGVDDSGTGNTITGLVIESVRVGYDLGENATGPYLGRKGTTNATTILGTYLEDGGPGSIAVHARETAAGVTWLGGYRTGYIDPLKDEGVSTTLLPGGNFATSRHGQFGGHMDFLGDSLSLKNGADNLVLETERSSFAFQPALRLNQKHANDVRILNDSAAAGSATLRVDNVTAGREMLRVSGQGDLRTGGDVEVGDDLKFTGGPSVLAGTGVPTAFAPDGSLYLRTDGGAGATLFVREQGAWVAK